MTQNDRLKKSELWGAAILLVLHAVLFPIAVGIASQILPVSWSAAQMNFVYYCASLVMTFVLLGRFLRRSFDTLCDYPLLAVKIFFLGWIIAVLLSNAMTLLLGLLGLAGQTPNDSTVSELVSSDYNIMLALTVILAPIVEETIFRGGIFGGIRAKSRFWAYAASMVLFALYHVWQYAFVYWDLKMLLYGLQYLPVGFVLCWCYDKSGSVWTSIVFHMSYNLLGMLAL